MRLFYLCAALLVMVPLLVGCKAFGLDGLTPIVLTDPSEQFYLVKDAFLTSGSPAAARKSFDRKMHPLVHLHFTPKSEKNHYVAESRWFDPLGTEFRTIRMTYDKQQEGKEGIERPKGGTTRVHTMPTSEFYAHKPGMWKVALYLDGKLARKLSFSVR